MKKLLLIIHTIIHLRPIQIRYQIWYRLRKMWRKASGFSYPLSIKKQGKLIKLQPWIEKPVSYSEGTFTFLNLSKKYNKGNINWNETQHGKLWAYNLNYMDYLLQSGIDKLTGLQLIENFIQHLHHNPTALEPYPIALRGINWVKFLSSTVIARSRSEAETKKQTVTIQQIDSSLYAQYKILLNNLEYHLLANHLLEDGFSLLFGGFYFSNEALYNKGKEIVTTELEKQILNDGAHFELSPMYQQIILDHLLDCINLVQNNQRFDGQETLLKLMQQKAQKMITWLNTITFSNGEIPLLNDAAPGIAPTTKQLNEYANKLNLLVLRSFSEGGNLQPGTWNLQLKNSGYRTFTTPTYECIIDIGHIGPSYQPGHAHADTFNFVLNVKYEPVILDTGISTYDTGKTRLKERGTAAHNTVTVQDKNSSEVWSSFRVAKRAKVKIIKDEKNHVIAQHDGYKKLGTIHKREWLFAENQIVISDTLTGKNTSGTAHFHFTPGIQPQKTHHGLTAGNISFTFDGAYEIKLIQSQIPDGYNRFKTNYKAEVHFINSLITKINML